MPSVLFFLKEYDQRCFAKMSFGDDDYNMNVYIIITTII